ncbi:uncharacterized protein LOC143695039 [Agelaius phoeniceus]|uniref:uncharacterized protein LOC143695039 n=1 Tax=Agelaius phoeniceus TaxID=39638 RepID=UPI0040550D71
MLQRRGLQPGSPRGCSGADRAGAWIGPTWLTAADPAETKPATDPGCSGGSRAESGQPGMGQTGPPLGAVSAVPTVHTAGRTPRPFRRHGQRSGRGPGGRDRDRRTGTDGPGRSRHRGWGSRERVGEQTGMDEQHNTATLTARPDSNPHTAAQ